MLKELQAASCPVLARRSAKHRTPDDADQPQAGHACIRISRKDSINRDYPERFVGVRRVRLGASRQLTSHVLLDLHPQLHDLARPPREHACSAAQHG